MLTPRQQRAKKRIDTKRKERAIKRTNFALKLAKRRGLDIVPFPCQQSHTQIVSEVHEAGNLYFYKSCACAGCPQGAQFMRDNPNDTPSTILGCDLVKRQVLLSSSPIRIGEKVVAVSVDQAIKNSFKEIKF